MRGKGVVYVFVPEKLRITPAHAGKRFTASVTTSQSRDHPRTCGEKSTVYPTMLQIEGSPPHVRGKEAHNAGDGAVHRITPAYAGKRLHKEVSNKLRLGITPACAGKRLAATSKPSPAQDHPRMCGEKASSTSPMKCLKGSPPRMRGKATRAVCDDVAAGITPACAGKRSDPSPAAVPAGPAGSCPASRPSQFPPRMTVIKPRP